VLKITTKKFLRKLITEKKIKLVNQNYKISKSYSNKTKNCQKAANLLYKNNLYENSITEAYFGMYNSTISLFFKMGIKCDNHTGAILFLKYLLKKEKLSNELNKFKEQRIDKQYNINENFNKKQCLQLIIESNLFIDNINFLKSNINIKLIDNIKEKFNSLKNRFYFFFILLK
jgi:uncharacterized protein (UPF0332 family)